MSARKATVPGWHSTELVQLGWKDSEQVEVATKCAQRCSAEADKQKVSVEEEVELLQEPTAEKQDCKGLALAQDFSRDIHDWAVLALVLVERMDGSGS